MGGSDTNKERIERDIVRFNESVRQLKVAPENRRTLDIARMYASDARSYMEKGDLYTAFSCISYAHGLVDALKEFAKKR